ncbi:MAG: DUF5320 domain-containing protein [Clostridiales bacterium]|nr:DUF5320 domain-containing protein [Clostridiales bacterium]
MPRMDGTGPMGTGAMTGRGFGPCGGGQRIGCTMGRGGARGRGAGAGRGMNYGQGYGRAMAINDNPVQASREQLQQRRDNLKAQLDALDKTLQSE